MLTHSIRRIRIEDGFIVSAATILTFTGLAKIWAAFGQARILSTADPVFGLEMGHMMLAVGNLELIVAALCFLGKSSRFAIALIAWLGTNFVLYRLALWLIGWGRSCPCLGNLWDSLHIAPQTADTITAALLAYLVIPSYGLLLQRWCGRGGCVGNEPR